MARRIKLMADYDCWPLWDIDTPDNLDPATLPLSPALQRRLNAWAEAFDSILNREDPAASGWASPEAQQMFEREGRALWERLCQELGSDYEVIYAQSEG